MGGVFYIANSLFSIFKAKFALLFMCGNTCKINKWVRRNISSINEVSEPPKIDIAEVCLAKGDLFLK